MDARRQLPTLPRLLPTPLLASSPFAARSCTEHTVIKLKMDISLRGIYTDVAAFLLRVRRALGSSCSLLAHSCSLITYTRFGSQHFMC
jgi:hypothetical protein